MELSKAAQKANGESVPEMPLSVGSKLKLLLRAAAFVFANCPYTFPYTHAFVGVCIYYIAVYILYNVQDTERRRGFCTLVPNGFKCRSNHACNSTPAHYWGEPERAPPSPFNGRNLCMYVCIYVRYIM